MNMKHAWLNKPDKMLLKLQAHQEEEREEELVEIHIVTMINKVMFHQKEG